MGLLETIGPFLAIGLTVGVFTLPFRDNLYWKVLEQIYIGMAAGYLLTVAWDTINSNLIGQLTQGKMMYLVPLFLSILLYSRYAPSNIGWLNRYPIALLVGTGIAISVRTVVDASIVKQILNTIIPPFPADPTKIVGTPATPINNIWIILTVILAMYVFLFSKIGAWSDSKTSANIRRLGVLLILMGFGTYQGTNIIKRFATLGGRFDFMLAPEHQLYTAFFVILSLAAVWQAREAERKSGQQLD